MDASTKLDRRREGGRKTRERLLDAAVELLAERGEDAVTLRDITDSAEANVAAVSYHFGCMGSLLEAVLEHSMSRVLDAQEEGLRALGEAPCLEAVAKAFARPVVTALATGGRELELIQIVARVGIDPPEGWGERLSARFAQVRGEVVDALRPNLPDTPDEQLSFRVRCASGLLNWFVLGPMRAELERRPEDELEPLMIPVLVGTFRADAA
ncbi:MAG TPA: TetR family transcriptional regulator [Solirubrobacteraceae bacterium]|jgi:AcrR family transcriptional regulator